MKQLLTLIAALGLIACAKQPAADNETSVIANPTPSPTPTIVAPTPSPTPGPTPASDNLTFAAKNPQVMNADGTTLLHLTGTFLFPSGADSQGRTILSWNLHTASNKVCTIFSITTNVITCYLAPTLDGGGIPVDQTTEDFRITRTLSDNTVQDISIGNIVSKVKATFTFTDLVNSTPFNINAGVLSGVAAGWWTLSGPTLVMANPYVYFNLKNTSTVAAVYKLNYNFGEAYFQPDASNCGTQDGAGYNNGTLQPGESCTLALRMTNALSANPAGQTATTDNLWVRYDDRLGNTVTYTQAVRTIFSN
jgi:hypothetical protein